MKKFFTLIAVLLSMLSSFAQPNEARRPFNNQGRLSISTVTNDPVRVLVDGNNYSIKGNDDERTINDIRPGYHSIKVYQQKRSKNNSRKMNKNMQLVYEGNIYVKPQYHVDVVINRFGKAFIDERQMNAGYYDDNDDNGQGGWENNDNNMQPMNYRSFEQFKQVIRNESYDNTRLIAAKQTIASNYFSSAQVKEIAGLFSFENSKLDMAKYSYRYTVDKNNYFILNDVFAYSSSKEELARFIQAYR
ncbi:MAG: DUF4476 domain-containing protein [Ferruginibacter sp.]